MKMFGSYSIALRIGVYWDEQGKLHPSALRAFTFL
jgi:hypothetical protein